MYRCTRCGGTFETFLTPGQCPLCGGWADVRCMSCGHTDEASVFVANNNRCPACGAEVALPGATDVRTTFSVRDFVTGVGLLLLLTSCCMPLTMWDDIRRSGYLLLLVVVTAAAGAVGALWWGLKDRMTK